MPRPSYSLRDQVARAIHEECSGSPWPDGGTVEQIAEREHWYACADRALEAAGHGPAAALLREHERRRQAAYLYSIIQSAESSEGGGPETDVERAYDAGILYAARMVLDNETADNDWTTDLYEYEDEIRARSVPGTPLPDTERKVVDAAVAWWERYRGWFTDDPDRAEPEDLALIAAIDALEEAE